MLYAVMGTIFSVIQGDGSLEHGSSLLLRLNRAFCLQTLFLQNTARNAGLTYYRVLHLVTIIPQPETIRPL
jgi:hypothetical protein